MLVNESSWYFNILIRQNLSEELAITFHSPSREASRSCLV